MRNFLEWLFEGATAPVVINDKNIILAFQKQADIHIDYAAERHHQVSVFNPQQFLMKIQRDLANYPLIRNLINALQSKNLRYIFDQQSKLRNWIDQQPNNMNLRTLFREVYTYVDSLDKGDLESSKREIEQLVQQALAGTHQEMLKLKELVEQAISRMPNWGGSPVFIEPSASQNEWGNGITIEPATTAEITLGSRTGDTYPPQFMIYRGENGQIEIDDVLDGGDDDFFASPQIQGDYFNLINELKKPGSTSKGKVLTLYTARPVEDREQFLNAKTVPANLFLSNDYDHVEGLAHDLSSGKVRDIWKLRIDSRYLTQTLDGRTKYYQITVQNAPVVALELITPSS